MSPPSRVRLRLRLRLRGRVKVRVRVRARVRVRVDVATCWRDGKGQHDAALVVPAERHGDVLLRAGETLGALGEEQRVLVDQRLEREQEAGTARRRVIAPVRVRVRVMPSVGEQRRVVAVRACGVQAACAHSCSTVGIDAHLFGKCVSSSSSSIVSRSEQPISITAEVRPGGTVSVPPLRCATCIVARSASPCMVTVVSDAVRRTSILARHCVPVYVCT